MAYIIAGILALLPLLPIVLALLCDAVGAQANATGDGVSADELTLWSQLLRYAIILKIMAPPALFLGAFMFWLLNWKEGLTHWVSWTCVLLGSIALILLGGVLGMVVGLIVVIFVISSEHLAFWR